MAERARTAASMAVDDVIFSGFYPRVLCHGLDPQQALGDYVETYVERDIRCSNEIRNLSGFRRFIRLCAGRVGQLVNFSSLGADAGVSHTTARQWLTILDASYVVFRLEPYHANIAKRLIKSSKLYFHDVGLACYLIGIENARQVATHPLRGPLFENTAVAETLKHRFNRGRRPHVFFFWDSGGLECDLLCETGRDIAAIEVKSGVTVSGGYFTALHKVAGLIPGIASKTVVYGGADRTRRGDAAVVPLSGIVGVLDRLDRMEPDQSESDHAHDRTDHEPEELASLSGSVIRPLDTVHSIHIQPVVKRLRRSCNQIGRQLFRTHTPSAAISHLDTTVESDDLSDNRRWESALSQLSDNTGFRLNDSEPVIVSYQHRFHGYTGHSSSDFNVKLRIQWRVGSNIVTRTASLDGTQATNLKAEIRHTESDTAPADTDRVAAVIITALLDHIDESSQNATYPAAH